MVDYVSKIPNNSEHPYYYRNAKAKPKITSAWWLEAAASQPDASCGRRGEAGTSHGLSSRREPGRTWRHAFGQQLGSSPAQTAWPRREEAALFQSDHPARNHDQPSCSPLFRWETATNWEAKVELRTGDVMEIPGRWMVAEMGPAPAKFLGQQGEHETLFWRRKWIGW